MRVARRAPWLGMRVPADKREEFVFQQNCNWEEYQ
jgi:hypothetical protein